MAKIKLSPALPCKLVLPPYLVHLPSCSAQTLRIIFTCPGVIPIANQSATSVFLLPKYIPNLPASLHLPSLPTIPNHDHLSPPNEPRAFILPQAYF